MKYFFVHVYSINEHLYKFCVIMNMLFLRLEFYFLKMYFYNE